MPYAAFETHLKKLGLSDKESAVYVAALQLGPETVQNISRRSKVARATTYLVLQALMKKGLVTRFEEASKTTFVAEPPHQLEILIEQREKQLKKDRSELKNLLPMLEAFVRFEDQRPLVRYYEGIEGLRALRSEITRQSDTTHTWYQIAPIDYIRKVFGEENFTYATTRRAKGIRSKALIITESKQLKEKLIETSDRWAQRKFLKPSQLNTSSGLVLLKDKVAVGTYSGRIGGVVIESKSITEMLRGAFELLWDRLE